MNWEWISQNPNITMDIIEKHPNQKWSWFNGISTHPNITMEIIEKYPNHPWDWNGYLNILISLSK